MLLSIFPSEAGNGYIELCWNEPIGGGQGGGDSIEDPFIVTGLPFEDFGTTSGFNDDYDEECPYTGSTSSDVVYLWSATPGDYHLDICDSNYDTKLYIL